MNSKNEFPGSPSNHFVTVSPKPILVNRAIRPTGKKAGKIEEGKKERGKERRGQKIGEDRREERTEERRGQKRGGDRG